MDMSCDGSEIFRGRRTSSCCCQRPTLCWFVGVFHCEASLDLILPSPTPWTQYVTEESVGASEIAVI